MVSLGQPTLAGVVLPRPTSHTRTPMEVSSTTTLADGSDATYHLGHRMVFDMSWDLATDDTAALVERLGMLVGPVEYVDLDGTSYVVTVNDRAPREAIRGTDPVRYTVGITVQEAAPRQVAPPEPTGPVVSEPVGDPNAPQAVVSDDDPNILLVYAGVVDPANPGVLVWDV